MKLTLLLFTTFILVRAQNNSAARAISYCGLLDSKIYCFGGSQVRVGMFYQDPTMFVLDITKANRASMDTLTNSWETKSTITANVDITEERYWSQSGVVGGTRLVVSGGSNGEGAPTAMVDQTIAYNVQANSWEKYSNYVEAPYGNRQIYGAATVVIPDKGLAFYGGLEQHINKSWTINTNQNLSATVFDGSRSVGYTRVTYLDINNALNPWTVATASSTDPSFFSYHQTSIYDPFSKAILLFGGSFLNTLLPQNNSESWHQFSYIMCFYTSNGMWINQTAQGVNIPSQRWYHTTTLLPNKETTVLLYGGEGESNMPLPDYCYTLDLISFNWTLQNISAPFVDLRRTEHSTILVNNDTLFIVNGIDSGLKPTSTPIVLNISNPDVISYMETYTDPILMLTSSFDSPRKLAAGQVAGIVIGASTCAILAVFIFIMYLRKKNIKQQPLESENPQLERKSHDRTKGTVMEVDWDAIEKQYTELPPANHSIQAYSSIRDSITMPDFVSIDNDTITVVGNTVRPSILNPPTAADQDLARMNIVKPDICS